MNVILALRLWYWEVQKYKAAFTPGGHEKFAYCASRYDAAYLDLFKLRESR